MFIVLNGWIILYDFRIITTSLPPNWQEHLVLAGPFLLLCISEGTFDGRKSATSQGGIYSLSQCWRKISWNLVQVWIRNASLYMDFVNMSISTKILEIVEVKHDKDVSCIVFMYSCIYLYWDKLSSNQVLNLNLYVAFFQKISSLVAIWRRLAAFGFMKILRCYKKTPPGGFFRTTRGWHVSPSRSSPNLHGILLPWLGMPVLHPQAILGCPVGSERINGERISGFFHPKEYPISK